MLNPACTPGTFDRQDDGTVTARCGCGWEETGLRSKSQAKAVQKEHRFPHATDPHRFDDELAPPPYVAPTGVPLAPVFSAGGRR